MVEYMHMIELKTSVLLAGATVIGALLGGADAEDCRRLDRFAVELGLAFQLQDDWLDVYGDPAVFGKKIGGDIMCGKKTFLLINAYQRANSDMKAALISIPRDSYVTIPGHDKNKINAAYAWGGPQLTVRTVEQLIGVAVINDVEKGFIAQIVEQKKAAIEVLGIDFRHVYLAGTQQIGNIDERFAVFLGGWRIHDHESSATSLPTEIAPETRVAAGRGQCGRGYGAPVLSVEEDRQLLIQPDLQLL